MTLPAASPEHEGVAINHSSPLRSRWADLSIPALVAGIVAVLVSFCSTAVLMVKAGESAGLSAAAIGSWIGAICLGLGVTGAYLSIKLRVPVIYAWSTPGAALLIPVLAGVPFDQAVGAFMLAAALTLMCGLMGWVDVILRRIPPELAAAMLAGVLFNFGMGVFKALESDMWLVLVMMATYLIGRRWFARYAIFGVLLAGLALALPGHGAVLASLDWGITRFVWTTPSFSVQAAVSIAIPLFIVAMASQNLPGLAILQAAGYRPKASQTVAASGMAGLLTAPFGAHSITLGAIVAAIMSGKEAHPDPTRRYWAAATYGILYIALTFCAGAVAMLFEALPPAYVAALAGLALLGPIMGGLTTAMANQEKREAALITVLATASGFTLGGIGSAFWGLVAGMIADAVLTQHRKSKS